MRHTTKVLTMAFLLLITAASARADKVLTIYCCGTGATEQWSNPVDSAWDTAELVASLYLLDKSSIDYTDSQETHYKKIVNGIGTGAGFFLIDLLGKAVPDWGTRPWWVCLADATDAIEDILLNSPGENLTINLLGWSRGGVLCMKIARWTANQPPAVADRITKVNMLCFDPVAGTPTDPVGTLLNEVELPAKVNQYVGLYAQDERSYKFEPMKPYITAATKQWLIRVRGSHETLVGNTQIDGHSVSTLPPDFDLPPYFKIPEINSPQLAAVSNISKAIAQELLTSSEWGQVEFPDDDTYWSHGYADKRAWFIQHIDAMNAYPEIGYGLMRVVAISPLGWGGYDFFHWLFYKEHLSIFWLTPVTHGRLCYRAPDRRLVFNHDKVFWLDYEMPPINRNNAWETLTWLRGADVVENIPPVANAGIDVTISSEEQDNTLIRGSATDLDNDPLYYQWLEGAMVLSTWQAPDPNGLAPLDLSTVPYFTIGDHTLTLEVDDGQSITSDDMVLKVENSNPHPFPAGEGTYEIGTPVTLGGEVSDFDGDLVFYEWLDNGDVLFIGKIQTLFGGDPVDLGEFITFDLGLGLHVVTLRVYDGVNEPVSSDIVVQIVDTTGPFLDPEASKTTIWPPNNKMVKIIINTNVWDNSGAPVTLTAEVSSNEDQDGKGNGKKEPDWTEPEINQETGIIQLNLRAERSGKEEGRKYTVLITATDESDNTSTAEVIITVPHNKKMTNAEVKKKKK